MDKLTFKFGELEAILADLNDIPSPSRTSFQARLKNFHRLGFPAGIGQGRGKAAVYTARELILMAVAIEMTQLGLTPERTIEVITDDEFPLWTSVLMASKAIEDRPEGFRPRYSGHDPEAVELEGFNPEWADSKDTDPFSFFLYFDPSVLVPTSGGGTDAAAETFFFGGAGVVSENLSRWTTGRTRRISLINVTSLLWNLAAYIGGSEGLKVVQHFGNIASDWVHSGDFDLDGWLGSVAKSLAMVVAARPEHLGEGKNVHMPLEKFIRFEKQMGSEDGPLGRFITPCRQEKIQGLPDRIAPDAIINLPGQRSLMVDSKIYLTADIPQQGIQCRIDELLEQPYRTAYADRTNYIVLYIPSEHFLAGAVAADKGIVDRALEHKIILASPGILLNLLAEVGTAWDKYREEHGDEEFDALLNFVEA